jgi:hypothetical protein
MTVGGLQRGRRTGARLPLVQLVVFRVCFQQQSCVPFHTQAMGNKSMIHMVAREVEPTFPKLEGACWLLSNTLTHVPDDGVMGRE